MMRIQTAGREFAGIVGFAVLGYGLWHAWWPLCPIVLGSMLLLGAVVGHLRAPLTLDLPTPDTEGHDAA